MDVASDRFETLLLILLEELTNKFDSGRRTEGLYDMIPAGKYVKHKPLIPTFPALINWQHGLGITKQDKERLYSTNSEMLLNKYSSIFGKNAEMAAFSPVGNEKQYDIIKWFGFKKLKSLPRPCWTIPNVDIYQLTQRFISEYGEIEKIQMYTAFHRLKNKPAPVYIGKSRNQMCNEQSMLSQTLLASLLEDFYRDSAWIVKIGEYRGFKLSVEDRDILDLFKLRETPRTVTGRRRPLLHWVKQHTRSVKKYTEKIVIPKHLRGITEFEMDGYPVSVLSPEKRVS